MYMSVSFEHFTRERGKMRCMFVPSGSDASLKNEHHIFKLILK